MSEFRVKINLSEFYSDLRREAYIYVKCNDAKTIKQVQEHICALFAIEAPINLTTSDGVYLPAMESARIIQGSDTILVRRCSSPLISTTNALLYSNSTVLDNCNLAGLFQSQETPIFANGKKKAAERIFSAANNLNRGSSACPSTTNSHCRQHQPVLVGDEEESRTMTTTPKKKNQLQTPATGENKKKRKRVRKRKNKRNSQLTALLSEDSPKQDAKSATVRNGTHTHRKPPPTSSSTSYSSSDEDRDIPIIKKKSAGVTKKAMPNTSRIIVGVTTAPQNKSGQLETVAIEDNNEDDADEGGAAGGEVEENGEDEADGESIMMSSTMANASAEMQMDRWMTTSPTNSSSRVLALEESVESRTTANLNNTGASLEEVRKNWASYPLVQTMPAKNEIIGFRMLRMGENYVPELSLPIIGLVEAINEATKDLEVVILAGNEELLRTVDGKFSMPEEEEQQQQNETLADDGVLHINWTELKDVRYVSSD